MTKVDYVVVALFAWSSITGAAMRKWCHSHLRDTHPVEFDVVERSDSQNWMHILDYPLSECRRNSITDFLYHTCLRGSPCEDCQWACWLVMTADLVWLATIVALLIRMNFLKL